MPPTPNYWLADVLVTAHLAFVAFVVVGQLLILVGWVCGWGWVRNFWFRLVHLTAIGVVAAEGLAGEECPLTTWERNLRGGNLHNVEGSVWLGRVSNRILFYQVSQENMVWFQRGHIAFGVFVFGTFVLVPPRGPRRRPAPTAPAGPPAPEGPPPEPAQAVAAGDLFPVAGRPGG
jgi:hypothetical protein